MSRAKPDLRIVIMILVLIATASPFGSAHGQAENDETLSIHFRRNLGYSLGLQMQGAFTISVEGPQDLVRVEFLLDGKVIGQDSEAPFNLAFNTRDYTEGIHRFDAVGYRANGEQIRSASVSRQFVTTSVVMIVVIAIVALVIAFRAGSYFLARRAGRRGAAYGYLGGTVCPNCGRAYGIHWWSLKLGVGRYDRCPHCGKWKMVRRASTEALLVAKGQVGDKLEDQKGSKTASDEEARRRRIEESRYDRG